MKILEIMRVEGGLRVSGILKEARPSLPLVSIVTVVYKGKDTITRTIKSVLEQDYKNIEYIIIDGGSTDGTIQAIQNYADKIDYFLSERDGGIYDAMNKGLAYCNGDLIGIINSDDWYEPGVIKEVAEAFQVNSECVHYGLMRVHDRIGALEINTSYASRLPQKMIPHPTCFVPATLYRRLGHFNTKYRVAADYDLMLRIYVAGERFCIHNSVLANFTKGGACQSNDDLAKQEVIRIRYENGTISKQRFRKSLLLIKLLTPIRHIRLLLKRLLL